MPPAPGLPDLSGKIACVTGASGVIGRGIALRFAEAGAAVAVHHRRPGAADDVVAAIEAAGGRLARSPPSSPKTTPCSMSSRSGAAGSTRW
ncbi:SDR family NAD(P)-dependent oxidoreductase [Amycolatopsis mediterranei]|uniref:SDR family NAD(P)-dependent oxidoreductase n=1 Tax=Amycolatopsis mediterranei TaxID=33910 RepID=UPI003F4E0977